MKFLIVFIFAILFFASCGTRKNATIQDPATFDEGVVINGIRWATRNVDAPGTFAESPESFGMFFQWNRRKGWSAVDRDVEGWDNTDAGGAKWYAKNDPCPEGWRVPTAMELRSLNNARSRWITQNGVYGRTFGNRRNQIFLPATGWRIGGDNGRIIHKGDWGLYWSNDGMLIYEAGPSFCCILCSPSSNEPIAMYLLFGLLRNIMNATNERTDAFPIRCVAK